MRIESICLGSLATNCYLVSVDGTTIIIDPAEPSELLHSFIGRRTIDLVVNTHGHFDHVGGNWVLQKQGARVRIHPADIPYVDHFYPDHPAIDSPLEEGEEIAGILRVLHVPGHSPGSIALKGDGVIFSGDLLFAGSIGRTDLPGGSVKAMRKSLERILALPGDVRIYPGHGEATTVENERRTNPFVRCLPR
jgi:glyoxylase-like metal-dependent hydrolase (beta-lactamase superfamily II)